jgi:hypothetical protein
LPSWRQRLTMPRAATSPHRASRKRQIRLSRDQTRQTWRRDDGTRDSDGGRVTSTADSPAIRFRPPGRWRTSTNVGEAGSVQVQIHKFISCFCVGAFIAYRQQTKVRILFPRSAFCTRITAGSLDICRQLSAARLGQME